MRELLHVQTLFCFAWLLSISSTPDIIAQVDTDGDGRLDVVDAAGFDPDATGSLRLIELGIQDLDGANLLTGLEELLLDNNRITSVEPGDFEGLSNLEVMNLGGNRITSVESGDFEGLTNLLTLSLNNNRVTSIESGDFDGLDRLRSLVVGNQITSVERGDFEGLENLQGLSLRRNQLTRIETGAFEGLTNLESLSLVLNQITDIKSGDFIGLGSLRSLQLSDNQITSIDRGDFDGLPNLTTLRMLRNAVTDIESGAFDGLPLLQIFLDNNRLTSIDRGHFDGLPDLWWLNLTGNRIERIESRAFEGMKNLQSLALNSNRLRELNFTGATFESLETCESPFGFCVDRRGIRALTLDDAILSNSSFEAIISQTSSLTEASLVGVTFADSPPNDLGDLLGIDSLENVSVDQALFDAYADEFTLFDAVDGNTVTIVQQGDCDMDGMLTATDLACVETINSRDAVLATLATTVGDLDGNGEVGFADFSTLAANFGRGGTGYSEGNVDLRGGVEFADFLILSDNFGKNTAIGNGSAVPEPTGSLLVWFGLLGILSCRLRNTNVVPSTFQDSLVSGVVRQ